MIAGRRLFSISVLAALLVAALLSVPSGRALAQGSAPSASGANAGSFDVEAATRTYLDRLTPEQKERSDSYFEGGYWLQLWGFLLSLGVSWLLLAKGRSARMRDLAERWTRFRFLQRFLYVSIYILLTSVLTLPWVIYTGFAREHQYKMANQTFGPWLGEQALSLVIDLILGGLAITVLYRVLQAVPRTAWIWGTAVAVLFLMFGALIAPVFINPLFNTYTRLNNPAIRDPILSLARANGVPAGDVWVSDASKQTTRVSANVSGFAGTERITLNDNLLNKASQPEIEAVMGHELGHYVLNHVYELVLQFGLLIAAGFAFVSFSFERARARWGQSWGLRGIDDIAGLPLMSALLAVFFFVATPITNTIIRVNEAEADLFGLNTARQPDGFAEAALKLGEYRKLEPGPIEEWIFFDHPSGESRIRMAMKWKAEHLDDVPATGR